MRGLLNPCRTSPSRERSSNEAANLRVAPHARSDRVPLEKSSPQRGSESFPGWEHAGMIVSLLYKVWRSTQAPTRPP